MLAGWLCLVGCTAVNPVALPTQAMVAVLPTQITTPSLTVTIDTTAVPPTWTAVPLAATMRNPLDQLVSVRPSLTPSLTPILPSPTPRPTATPMPSATAPTLPTRYVSYIPHLPPSTDLGPSKLGLHVIQNNNAGILDFVQQGQPSVIKAVDDFGYLRDVRAVSPRTIIVARIDDINSQNYSGEPEEAAKAYVQSQLAQYQANPAVDYWEGWNEPDPNLDNMQWYTRFEQERVRLLAQHGYRAAVGGFAAGVPEMDEFRLFVPAIETAIEYHGILTLHEYAAPDMTYLYGAALPGYPAYADRGALTFRYRWFYRDILEPAGLVIPLVISEAGIDGIIGDRPGPQGLGWKDFQNYWVDQGWASNGVDAFVNQLAWYDNGVRQDGYVIGFTVFTAGGYGYWLKYDINPILPDLLNYVKSQQ